MCTVPFLFHILVTAVKLSQRIFVLLWLFFVVSASCSYTLFSGDGTAVVANAPERVCPVLVGTSIPSAEVYAPDGTPVDLRAVLGGKPTLLIVYRGGWCPYCNRHLTALMDIEKPLLDVGYQIVAISADRPEKMQQSMEKGEWQYQLFSDSSVLAAQALGLAFVVDKNTIQRYKKYNIDLEEASGRSHHILPVPAAFIVDASGVVAFSYVNPNYKLRIDAEVLLAAARSALQNK